MSETVKLDLPRDYAGQILDGLDVLIEQWEYTAEYLESGLMRDDLALRECTNPEEARWLAAYYGEIRSSVRQQINFQKR